MCDRTKRKLCDFVPQHIILSQADYSFASTLIPSDCMEGQTARVSGQYFYPCQHFVYLHNMLRKQCHLLCGLSEKRKKKKLLEAPILKLEHQ